jgi:lysophospholipase L1-like esterase
MKRLTVLIYYLVFLFIFVGALFHLSDTPQVLRYSYKYAVFLILLATGFFVPPFILFLSRKHGSRIVVFACIPAIVLLVIIYFVSSQWYYYTQEHRFDPFLQMPSPQLKETKLSKPADTYRILFLGGSTTRNSALPKEVRFPTRLKSLIGKNFPERKVEVFNAGMDWYTTKHSLINYVTNLRDWQPDLVVVMHAINDLYRSFSPPIYAEGEYNRHWSHFYGPSINGVNPPTFEEHLFSRTFYSLYSQLREYEVDYPLSRYVSLNEYRRNLRTLIEYLKSDQRKVIIMTQPSLYKDNLSPEENEALWFGKEFCYTSKNIWQREYPSAKSLRTAIEAFNDAARNIAEDNEVMLIDLDVMIAKNLSNFSDDVHYTEKGSNEIATAIMNNIVFE